MEFNRYFIITVLLCITITALDAEQDLFNKISFKTNVIKCSTHDDCEADEYCDSDFSWKSFKRATRVCYKRLENGKSCNGYNYQCASNHCHWFSCNGRQNGSNVAENGKCKNNEDCVFKQYCKSNKCINRKSEGWCTSDEQCLSNHCSFYKKCKKLKQD
jgi:hypothetical protein